MTSARPLRGTRSWRNSRMIPSDAHLAILYGEAGETERVEKMTAAWTARGGMLAVLAPIINTAYLGRRGCGRGR